MSEYQKPPLGLRPKVAYYGDRMIEIRESIQRYTEAWYKIPQEWVDEYNQLQEELQKVNTNYPKK